MGCHFCPQFYLRGFAEELWVYQKGNQNPQLWPIKRIAQEKQFYSENTESYLANTIEMPANEILRKIRNQEHISPNEKEVLAEYIFIFFKRVPRAQQRCISAIPSIGNGIMKNIYNNLDQLILLNPERSDFYDNLRVKAKKIINGYKENPPKEIWKNSVPLKMAKVSNYLSQMTWIFYTCREPDVLITGDNPVFIHTNLGINKRCSELTFPISRKISLLANHWPIKDMPYVEAKSSLIKEMNRRTAHNATRFVYCPVKRDWITDLLNKKDHKIDFITPPGRLKGN